MARTVTGSSVLGNLGVHLPLLCCLIFRYGAPRGIGVIYNFSVLSEIKLVAVPIFDYIQRDTQWQPYKGKSYVLTFEWSDNKLYCAALMWKLYLPSDGRYRIGTAGAGPF